MALFKVENLTYCYGGADGPSLSGINLEINEGEFVLLIGSSGCGKSTLLRALSGLVPDFYGGSFAGQVSFKGKNIRNWDKRKLAGEVGFIFQDPEQQLVMTGVEREIAFGLENTGIAPEEMRRRVAEVMDYLNITRLKDTNIFELSGGQKQTVVLASVLAMQPKVLLLDEPTSQLDPVAAEELLGSVRRMNEELGLTVVLVEQRLERCLHLAHRVLIMESGRVANNSEPAAAVKYGLKHNSPFLPLLPKLFGVFGRTAIPLTVGEGRKVMQNLWPGNSPAAPGPAAAAKRERPSGNEQNAKLLEIENISFTYRGAGEPALKDFSLTAGAGEFIAVIGENGGGKSTLLKNICGLLQPQRGRINICGNNTGKLKAGELAGTVGYLSQNPNDYLFHDTVAEEVAFGLTIRGYQVGDTVHQILQKFQLSAVADKNPRDLSGGERQRVALAAVLVLKPQLLLLDEPTRGLDASLKAELGANLQNLVSEGMSVMVVTHDLEFVAEYARRVLIMFNGEKVADGDKRQVMNNALYYTSQLNKLFRGFCDEVITFSDALSSLKWCNYEVG